MQLTSKHRTPLKLHFAGGPMVAPYYKLWATTRETCLWGFANITDSDQPAHPRSLISAFVIHFVVIIICKLATGEISIF